MVKKEKDLTSAEVILTAARQEFILKGYAGARMQDIADRAGINKALLHYYYSTKEKLFDVVFDEAFATFIPQAEAILQEEIPVIDKLKRFVEAYLTMLNANPFLPQFVINEIWKNPEQFKLRMFGNEEQQGPIGRLQAHQFIMILFEAGMRGEIRQTDYRHFFINMISMCVFPFLARPMIQTLMQVPDELYKSLLLERTAVIHAYIDQSLLPIT